MTAPTQAARAMNDGPSTRRWFRFSLATLFVVVTVFACWLGYELNWIRQRHELLAEHRELAAESSNRVVLIASIKRAVDVHPPDWTTRFRLWMFQEHPEQLLMLFFTIDKGVSLSADQRAELQRAKGLFPEAGIGWEIVRPATPID